MAAAEEGMVLAKVRTFEELREELRYTEVLARMPLISVEKIGESKPIPFKPDAKAPLDGIRAFGMGHVIAGAAISGLLYRRSRQVRCLTQGCRYLFRQQAPCYLKL